MIMLLIEIKHISSEGLYLARLNGVDQGYWIATDSEDSSIKTMTDLTAEWLMSDQAEDLNEKKKYLKETFEAFDKSKLEEASNRNGLQFYFAQVRLYSSDDFQSEHSMVIESYFQPSIIG